MKLEDLVEFKKGDLILVTWEDILTSPGVSESTRVETCSSNSVGWFDEVYYGKTATLVIVTEVQKGMHVDKQAFPLGCVMSVVRLTEKVRSVI